jgi:hypothetical protein
LEFISSFKIFINQIADSIAVLIKVYFYYLVNYRRFIFIHFNFVLYHFHTNLLVSYKYQVIIPKILCISTFKLVKTNIILVNNSNNKYIL